jgi:two-component system response regulator DctR
MHCVVEGLPNKLIADQLHISVRTVEVHRARVFEKMAVRSAVELSNRVRAAP